MPVPVGGLARGRFQCWPAAGEMSDVLHKLETDVGSPQTCPETSRSPSDRRVCAALLRFISVINL